MAPNQKAHVIGQHLLFICTNHIIFVYSMQSSYNGRIAYGTKIQYNNQLFYVMCHLRLQVELLKMLMRVSTNVGLDLLVTISITDWTYRLK